MTDIERLQEENRYLREKLLQVEQDKQVIKKVIRTMAQKYGIQPGEENIQRKLVAAMPKLLKTIMMDPESLQKDFSELMPIIERYSHE